MSKYFCGVKISEYGMENNRVDYRTLAQTFNHVLNNDLMGVLEAQGYYFEQISGFIDNSDKIERIEEKIEELEELITEDSTEEEDEETQEKIRELEEEKEELEEEQEHIDEIFQYYIVDDDYNLKRANEIIFYCEELDLTIWGVTHWGTAWDYVLTDIDISDYKDYED